MAKNTQKLISYERLYKELSQEEGIRSKVYRDTMGFRTVGIGHNLDAEPIDNIIGRNFAKNPVLSPSEIMAVFKHDVDKVYSSLDRNINWWRTLPIFAQYVVISLGFNLGVGGLLKFKNFLADLKNHKYVDAAIDLTNSKWYTQVKSRGLKIVTVLRKGKFPDGTSE